MMILLCALGDRTAATAARALSEGDHLIFRAASASAALTLMGAQRPSLVILGGESRQALAASCRELRAAEGYRDTVVVAVGSDRPDDVRALIEAGADDFLAEASGEDMFRSRLVVAHHAATAVAARRAVEQDHEERFESTVRDARVTTAALRDLSESLATTLDSIGDGVIATDVTGAIVRMNPVAAHLTGWTFADAKGRSAFDVLPLFDGESRIAVESPIKRALREGVVVKLPPHTILTRRDGAEIPIADSCASIRDADGNVNGAVLVFPAGAATPHATGLPILDGKSWVSPFVDAGHRGSHPLAATYSLIVATFLGTLGLPHILVRFYTNQDGRAARRTTVIVLMLLGSFYVFPAVFAVLGRLRDPSLYLTGQTDSVVLVLPHALIGGIGGSVLGALVAAGAFAAFLSTSSGLLVSVAGAMAHDLMRGGVRTFRQCAVVAGAVGLVAGLQVQSFDLNMLVGWCFAIAASTFCPLLVLGIWWRRLTWVGAIAGLVLGGCTSSVAIILTMAGVGQRGWPGVLLGQPAIWTVPLAFLAMIVVSRATPSYLPTDLESKLLQLHLPEALRKA